MQCSLSSGYLFLKFLWVISGSLHLQDPSHLHQWTYSIAICNILWALPWSRVPWWDVLHNASTLAFPFLWAFLSFLPLCVMAIWHVFLIRVGPCFYIFGATITISQELCQGVEFCNPWKCFHIDKKSALSKCVFHLVFSSILRIQFHV